MADGVFALADQMIDNSKMQAFLILSPSSFSHSKYIQVRFHA